MILIVVLPCSAWQYLLIPSNQCSDFYIQQLCPKFRIEQNTDYYTCALSCSQNMFDMSNMCVESCGLLQPPQFTVLQENKCNISCLNYYQTQMIQNYTENVCINQCLYVISLKLLSNGSIDQKQCVLECNQTVLTILKQQYCKINGMFLTYSQAKFTYQQSNQCNFILNQEFCSQISCRDSIQVFGPQWQYVYLQDEQICTNNCFQFNQYVMRVQNDDICTICESQMFRLVNLSCSADRITLQCPKYVQLTNFKQCYLSCLINAIQFYSLADICLDVCPVGVSFILDNTCVYKCPIAWQQVQSLQMCIQDCNLIIRTDNQNCSSHCDSKLYFNISGFNYCSHCVYTLINVGSNTCVTQSECLLTKINFLCVDDQCRNSGNYFFNSTLTFNFNSVCTDCVSNFKLNSATCVSKCPSYFNSSFWCVSCDQKNDFRFLNLQCGTFNEVTQCPYYKSQGVAFQCVLSCGTQFVTQKQCVSSCPSQNPFLENLNCVLNCTNKLFQKTNQNSMCVQNCIGFISLTTFRSHQECFSECAILQVVDNKAMCWKSCDKNCTDLLASLQSCNGFVQDGKCVSMCQSENVSNVCQVSASSCEPGHAINTSSFSCVKITKDVFYEMLPNGQKIAVQCNGAKLGNQCINFKCPQGMTWVGGACYSAEKCKGNVESDGICYQNHSIGNWSNL